MKHIFSIHSNICVITIYNKVKTLVENGENVVIVSDRNTEFPFFKDHVKFYDIQYITDKYRKTPKNSFDKLVNYTFTYLPHYKKSASEVIQEDDFYLYMSSCNYFTISPYLRNKHCLGYYFLEEGTMSYMDYDILKKRYRKQLRHGQVLLNIIGSRTKFDYHIDERFKGCICINSLAFPWCKENKNVSDLTDYIKQIKGYDICYDYVIVTDYMKDNVDVIKKGFEIVLKLIFKEHKSTRIGVKMHPTAVSYEKGKINEIKKYLSNEYPSLQFDFLQSNYIIENLLIKSKITLFSVFGISSLNLYSVLLGSRSFMVDKKDDCILKEINSHEEIMEYVHDSVKGF